jgi:hypothetical protein
MCENFEWCVQRSLEYAKQNNYNQAIVSFMSDITKSECTKSINENGYLCIMILNSNKESLTKFENDGLRGFSYCCVCKK